MLNFKEYLKNLYCEAGLLYLVKNVDEAIFKFQLKIYSKILMSELEKDDLTISQEKAKELTDKLKIVYAEHFQNLIPSIP